MTGICDSPVCGSALIYCMWVAISAISWAKVKSIQAIHDCQQAKLFSRLYLQANDDKVCGVLQAEFQYLQRTRFAVLNKSTKRA